MEDWLATIVTYVVTIIQIMALLVVVFGTLQAFVHSAREMFTAPGDGRDFHAAYIRFARWLIAGLTFQLAADIVQTAFAPSWDEIGQLAAIAAIRAFINYFLERDLAHQEKRQWTPQSSPPDGSTARTTFELRESPRCHPGQLWFSDQVVFDASNDAGGRQ